MGVAAGFDAGAEASPPLQPMAMSVAERRPATVTDSPWRIVSDYQVVACLESPPHIGALLHVAAWAVSGGRIGRCAVRALGRTLAPGHEAGDARRHEDSHADERDGALRGDAHEPRQLRDDQEEAAPEREVNVRVL